MGPECVHSNKPKMQRVQSKKLLQKNWSEKIKVILVNHRLKYLKASKLFFKKKMDASKDLNSWEELSNTKKLEHIIKHY